MADQPSNRITVDLQLLASRDAKLLADFGKQFSDAVDELKIVTGNLAQQMNAAANQVTNAAHKAGAAAGGGGGVAKPLSTAYSDAGQHAHEAVDNQRNKWASFRDKAKQTMDDDRMAYSPSHPGDRSFFEMPRIGSWTAQDYFKQLSYGLGHFGYGKDENGKIVRTNKGMAWASRQAGVGARLAPWTIGQYKGARAVMGNIRARISGATSYGLQAGMPGVGSGWLGTSFMSPAFKEGISSQFDSLKRSWFGFNPNYSNAQSEAARQAVYGYGYSGGRAQYLQGQLQSVTEHTGLDANSAMQLLDPAMRYGTASVSNLKDQLISMSDAARGAGIAADQFRKDVIGVASQLSQNSIAPASYIAGGVSTTASVLGVAPSVVGQMAQNPLLDSINMAQKGGPAEAMLSKTPSADRINALNRLLLPYGGINGVKQIMARGKSDPRYESIAWMVKSGMIPMPYQALLMDSHKGINRLRHQALAGDLIQSGLNQSSMSPGDMHRVMRLMNISAADQADVLGGIGHHGITQRDVLNKLSNMLGKTVENSRKKAAAHNVFALTPEARRILLPLMNQQNDVSSSNSRPPNPTEAVVQARFDAASRRG